MRRLRRRRERSRAIDRGRSDLGDPVGAGKSIVGVELRGSSERSSARDDRCMTLRLLCLLFARCCGGSHCWREVRRQGMPSCWCCAMRSRCYAAKWPGHALTGPTGRCWPAWRGSCLARPGTACSSSPQPCSAGIGTWSDAAGLTPIDVAVRVRQRSSARWCCGWYERTRPGGIAASTASCAALDTRSGPAPCGRSCSAPGLLRYRRGRR